jgi:hypothetical protein
LRSSKLKEVQLENLERVLSWRLPPAVRQVVQGWIGAGKAPKHKIRAFTKVELLAKSPRCVCPMDPAMYVMLGPATARAEMTVGKLKFLVKGMTLTERSAYVGDELSNGCVWAETDYSAFDSTVKLNFREIEFDAYATYFTDEELVYFIILTCLSVITHVSLDGESDLGKLVIRSMRYSGEPGTSIGNGLVNYFVFWSNPERPKNAKCLCEGDDGNIVSVKRYDVLGWARSLGFRLTCDWHSDPRDVKFCGRYEGGDKFDDKISHCDITRCLFKLNISCGMSNGLSGDMLRRSKLLSAFSTDPNTPVISTLVWRLWHHFGYGVTSENQFSQDDSLKVKLAGGAIYPGLQPPRIDDEAYMNLVSQGMSSGYAKSYDAAVRASIGRQDVPLFDMEKSNAKYWFQAVGPLSR